jgi:hypothetical protein
VNGYRVTCQLDSVEANKIALNRKYDVTIVPA